MEIEILQRLIRKNDPVAFITLINAGKTIGEGNKSLNEKISD